MLHKAGATQSHPWKGRLKCTTIVLASASQGKGVQRNNRKKRIVPCSIPSQTGWLLRRQMRSSISIPILNIHKLSPAPAGDAYVAANAKMIVLQCFQKAVNQGWAEWKINADGQIEVHVQSGEVFLLLENTVTRMR
jgi:hypothetical protein